MEESVKEDCKNEKSNTSQKVVQPNKKVENVEVVETSDVSMKANDESKETQGGDGQDEFDVTSSMDQDKSENNKTDIKESVEESDDKDDECRSDIKDSARYEKSQTALARTVFIKNLPTAATKADLEACMNEYKISDILISLNQKTGASKGTAFVTFKDREEADRCLNADTKFKLKGNNLVCQRAADRAIELNKRKESLEKNEAKDREIRNLSLAKEGAILPGSEEAKGVSESDMAKRLELELYKEKKLTDKDSFITKTTLIVHNVPDHFDDDSLRELFEKHVTEKSILELNIKRNWKILNKQRIGKSKEFCYVTFTSHKKALAALRLLNNNPDIFSATKRPIVSFAIETQKSNNDPYFNKNYSNYNRREPLFDRKFRNRRDDFGESRHGFNPRIRSHSSNPYYERRNFYNSRDRPSGYKRNFNEVEEWDFEERPSKYNQRSRPHDRFYEHSSDDYRNTERGSRKSNQWEERDDFGGDGAANETRGNFYRRKQPHFFNPNVQNLHNRKEMGEFKHQSNDWEEPNNFGYRHRSQSHAMNTNYEYGSGEERDYFAGGGKADRFNQRMQPDVSNTNFDEPIYDSKLEETSNWEPKRNKEETTGFQRNFGDCEERNNFVGLKGVDKFNERTQQSNNGNYSQHNPNFHHKSEGTGGFGHAYNDWDESNDFEEAENDNTNYDQHDQNVYDNWEQRGNFVGRPGGNAMRGKFNQNFRPQLNNANYNQHGYNYGTEGKPGFMQKFNPTFMKSGGNFNQRMQQQINNSIQEQPDQNVGYNKDGFKHKFNVVEEVNF